MVPVSTWVPTSTGSSVTMPSTAAEMVCSIFMASIHSSGWPAVTVSPTETATRMTAPGMGASSEPAATSAPGSEYRGGSMSGTGPSGESTSTTVSEPTTSYRATEKVWRTPLTSRSTASGRTCPTRTTSARSPSAWAPERSRMYATSSSSSPNR